MSKFKTFKTITAIAGLTVIGGGAAFAGMHWDGIKKVAQGPVYTEDEVKEGYDEGYNEGLKINVGYTEEELQEQIKNALSNKKEYINFESVGAQGIQSYLILDNGNYLFTFKGTGGIWKYNIQNKNFEKLIDTPESYYNIETINDLIYITGTQTDRTGLYVYNSKTSVIEKVSETGRNWKKRHVSGNGKFIILGNEYTSTLFLVDIEKTEIRDVYNEEMILNRFSSTGNGVLIGNNTKDGLWYFSDTTGEMTKIYETGKFAGDIYSMTNGAVFILENVGVCDFNTKTNQIEVIDTNTAYTIKQYDDILIFTSKYSGDNDIGIKAYDGNSLISLDNVGFNWSACPVSNGYILTSTTSEGIYFYDSETQTKNQIYETGKNFSYFVCEKGVYLSGNMNNYGILYYNEETGEIEKKVDSGTAFDSLKLDDGYLLIEKRSDSQGIFYLDKNSGGINKIYDEGYSLKAIDLGSGIILSSGKDEGTPYSGLLFYNKVTRQITKLFNSGRGWTKVKKVDGCYLIFTSSTATSVQGVLMVKEDTLETTKILNVGHFKDFEIIDHENIIELQYSNCIYEFDVTNKTIKLKYDTSFSLT